MRNKHLLIFISFLALALTLRFPSFFQSIIDWDESLYILIGRSLKEGNLPYIEVWDHKPPGIYLLFALALIVFGNSIFAIRLLSCLAVALTSYFLYKAGTSFSKNGEKIGLLSGIFYIIFSLTNGGLSANTEIFFLPFTTIAFYLLIAETHPERLFVSQKLKLLLVGLSLGIGLLIKQLVIFDLIAMLLILGKSLIFNKVNNSSLTERFIQLMRSYSLFLFGAILPFLVTVLSYLISGHFNDFIYANFTANVLRSNLGFALNRFLKAIVVQTAQYFVLWSGLILTLLYVSFFKKINREDKDKLISGLIWFGFAFLGVCYTKDFWSHYFLQILPALCFLTSFIINQLVDTRLPRKARNIALIPIVIGLILSSYFVIRSLIKSGEIIYFRFVKGINNWGDPTAVVADYVRKRLANNYIYVVDDQPIIYFLAQAKVPTKYVFPGHLLGEDFAKVAGINSLQELNSIIKKKPVYILKRSKNVSDGRQAVYTGLDQYLKSLIEGHIAMKTSKPTPEITNQNKLTLTDNFYADLNKYLKEKYTLETVVEGIELYKLKN